MTDLIELAGVNGNEWHGEPHTLIVRAVHAPHGPLDDGCLDYDIEHPPSCKEERIGDGENSYVQWACDVEAVAGDVGLPFSLRYSGPPVTAPGTYQVQSWGSKSYVPDYGTYEYDGGIAVITAEGEA